MKDDYEILCCELQHQIDNLIEEKDKLQDIIDRYIVDIVNRGEDE